MIGKIIKGFRIVRQIGEGSMSNIYLAENSLGVLNAVKALKPHLSLESAEYSRFKQECAILQTLAGHPHIIQMHDCVEEEGRLYLFMEYHRDACTLLRLMHRFDLKKPNESCMLRWLQSILSALDYMHRHDLRITHCDINPSNILITKYGELKLIDFGNAQLHSSASDDNQALPDLSTHQGCEGTLPPFDNGKCFAPESKYYPSNLNAKSDIYMLGRTFDSLLRFSIDTFTYAGHRRLSADDEEQLRASSLGAFIEKATQYQPKDRFQSCQDIARFLRLEISPPSIFSESDSEGARSGTPAAAQDEEWYNIDDQPQDTDTQFIFDLMNQTLHSFSKLEIANFFYKREIAAISSLWGSACHIEHAFIYQGDQFLVLSAAKKYYLIRRPFEHDAKLIAGRSFDYISGLKNSWNPPNACFDYVAVKINGYYEKLDISSGLVNHYPMKCLSEKHLEDEFSFRT